MIVSRPSPNVALPTEKDLAIGSRHKKAHKAQMITSSNVSRQIRYVTFVDFYGFSGVFPPKTLISFDPELSARFSRRRARSTTSRPDGDSTPESRSASISGALLIA